MIGVIANPDEHDVVREFFELFKTPWEFYRDGHRYDVLLCTYDTPADLNARLIVFYAGGKREFDKTYNFPVGRPRDCSCVLTHGKYRIPVYGESVTLASDPDKGASAEDSEVAAFARKTEHQVLVRVGYQLFNEFRFLLTVGQPPENAGIPAVELHIVLLRELITSNGIPLTEIPPVPEGFNFIVCLTHDIDHPSLVKHRLDHTFWGLLYRAGLVSCWDFFRQRISIRNLLNNWLAIIRLPFVFLGVARDFWREFGDRYLEIEKGCPSTFFVIPFAGYPGRTRTGSAPKFRSARYKAADLVDIIRKLQAAGCEIGLHGIDAWLDSTSARKETEEIHRLTGSPQCGVRMHWLYFDGESTKALDLAGAPYDSTIGYNNTVGYRAGTSQAYRPLNSNRMLELPMHAMDTALFYPGYLHLSSGEARKTIDRLADHATQFGGVLTINWHDRSLAPERQWDSCYREIVEDLKSRGAWFATAGQAVSWFNKRRLTSFEMDQADPQKAHAIGATNKSDQLPGLRLRVHGQLDGRALTRFADFPVTENSYCTISSEVRR